MKPKQFIYYRFASGKYFCRNTENLLFYLLTDAGVWATSGWVVSKYYDAASDYEQVTEEEALAAANGTPPPKFVFDPKRNYS